MRTSTGNAWNNIYKMSTLCSDTRQPTQPGAIPTAKNPAACGCTPDGNHTTVNGTLEKSKIVSPHLGQHRGGLLTTKGDVNSPVVGQRPCQVTMVGKGNGHLAPRFPPTRQPIPPHNDPQSPWHSLGYWRLETMESKKNIQSKKCCRGHCEKTVTPSVCTATCLLASSFHSVAKLA